MDDLSKCLSGETLYGDDFTEDRIRAWYEEESEAYACLESERRVDAPYGYHQVNWIHGYAHLPPDRVFQRALGLGAAFGHEFLPLIDRIGAIDIVEPSERLVARQIGRLIPVYHSPTVSGALPFTADVFDLITCFGTLHHIPNVSFVLSELRRCLAPGGALLTREPITSMGDWRSPRRGLTKNERGIPLRLFRRMIADAGLSVQHESLCFAMTSFITRALRLKHSPLNSRTYVVLDKYLSMLLRFNATKYHRRSLWEKVGPGSVFFVLTKG